MKSIMLMSNMLEWMQEVWKQALHMWKLLFWRPWTATVLLLCLVWTAVLLAIFCQNFLPLFHCKQDLGDATWYASWHIASKQLPLVTGRFRVKMYINAPIKIGYAPHVLPPSVSLIYERMLEALQHFVIWSEKFK